MCSSLSISEVGVTQATAEHFKKAIVSFGVWPSLCLSPLYM